MDDFEALTHVVPTGLDIMTAIKEIPFTEIAACAIACAEVEAELAEAFRRTDEMLSKGFCDGAGLDPELLALAQQAIDAIAWRAYSKAWPCAMAGDPAMMRTP